MSAPILPFHYMMQPESTPHLKWQFFIQHTDGTPLVAERGHINNTTVYN